MDAIRVLLVEDNTSTRLLLRSYLDGLEGIEICAEAADGARGLELIWALEPDLVLLDLVMTGLDGLGLLRALRTTAAPAQAQDNRALPFGGRRHHQAYSQAGGQLLYDQARQLFTAV